MRSTFVLTLVLLFAAFAVAQQQPTAPSDPGQSQAQNPNAPSPNQAPNAQSPDRDQQRNLPQSDAPMPPAAAQGDTIEGCLGGTNPNFTVTDKDGTEYALVVPQGTDASVLSKHVGEPVQVQGAVDSAGLSAPVGGHSIRVARIGKGSANCSAKK